MLRKYFGEVLPYLEVTKNEETVSKQVEMPELINLTVKEAKQILNEYGLNYEVDTEDINAVIINQVPKKGIELAEGTKVILYTN